VSAAEGQGPALAVGPVLRDSIRLVLRHWIILVIGTLVLAEIALLNLSLLGHCFADTPPACSSSITTLGARGEWLIHSALDEVAVFLVASVAIYFLYSSTRIGIPEFTSLRKSRTRSLRLFARLGLVWIVILVPLYAFDIALWEVFETSLAIGASAAVRWLVYILRTIAIVAFSGYIHARLVIYLPTAAYSVEPDSWQESWERTRNQAARLFTVLFVIGFLLSAAQFGFYALAYRAPGYFDAVDFVSTLLGVRSNYVLRNLGQLLPFVILGVPGTVLEAAVSLVAFKVLMPAGEQSTADIFD